MIPKHISARREAKTKILHVLPGVSPADGVTRVVYSLLGNLDRTRFEPIVCTIANSDIDQIRAFEEIGVPVFAIQGVSSASPRHLTTHLRVIWQLAGLLRRQKVAVAHTHNFFSTMLGQAASVLAAVPVRVATMHGDVFPSYYGPISRVSSPFTDRVICISEAVRNFVLSSGACPASKACVIYNGIPLERLATDDSGEARRLDLAIPADAPVIGLVAALEKAKGHTFLIKSAPAVLREYPTARFLFVGGEPWFEPETPRTLYRLVDELGIKDSVVFTGPRDDVPGLLSAMDVFVFPPLNAGFGLALAEAMYLGKPIIATAVGAIPEVLGDDGSGVLVPPADPDALAQAILGVLGDRDRAIEMGRHARERVERLFTVQRMAVDYERLYDQLCAQKMVGEIRLNASGDR